MYGCQASRFDGFDYLAYVTVHIYYKQLDFSAQYLVLYAIFQLSLKEHVKNSSRNLEKREIFNGFTNVYKKLHTLKYFSLSLYIYINIKS